MNSIFLIIFDLKFIRLQVVLVILVVRFSEKNHLHLFGLEAKKLDAKPENSSNSVLKTRVTGKKKKIGFDV